MEAQRSNGIIVAPLGTDRKSFVSTRQHMFTPLDNITVFTTDDAITLKEVLREMKKQSDKNPPADANADGGTLRAYFSKIVPNHDAGKVYTSDIKKILKWYGILEREHLITLEDEKKEDAEQEEKETTAAGPKTRPGEASKKSAAKSAKKAVTPKGGAPQRRSARPTAATKKTGGQRKSGS